ncbi:MAG: O-antigen ligase family protein [Cyclobacteriaceae bacterium]
MTKKLLTIQHFMTLCFLGFFIGQFFISDFQAFASSSMLIMGLSSLYYIIKSKKKITFSQFYPLLFFIFPIFLQLAQYGMTEVGNEPYYKHALELKALFFIFPVTLSFLPGIERKHFFTVLYVVFLITVLFSLGLLINYFFHFKEVNISYMYSKIMPIRINHIRYSLMVTSAIFSAFYLLKKKFEWKYKWERNVILGGAIFLIIFLHIFSVRSGLVSFYIMGVLYGTYYSFKNKKYLLIACLHTVIFLVPVIAYVSMPTFKNKMTNTLNDIAACNQQESANQYSLAGRVYAYKVSQQVFFESPWLGVGVGNYKARINEAYTGSFPLIHKDQYKLTHNQFFRYAISYGILGLIVFVLCFYYPLFYAKNYLQCSFLIMHYGIVTLSFLVEDTLNTTHGQYYAMGYIFLCFSFIKGLRGKQKSESN